MDGPEFDAGMDTRAGTPQGRNGRQGTREGPESPARPPMGTILAMSHRRAGALTLPEVAATA